jgi:ABC-type antimicrobial peptide transport system permease subunit
VFAHRPVSPGYFETHGIQLVDGRPIGETDGASNPPVAVLNEMAAQMLWPAERAVGKRMSMGAGEPLTVIGVIPNAKNQALDEGVFPQLYTGFFQFGGPGYGTLSVRYTPGRAASLDLVRNAITAIEPDVETREWSMAGLRWELVAEERFRTFTLLTFAGIALILAVVGIFGVIAYSVVQKQREIGIRIAVGATRRHVRSLILGQAIAPVLVGLGIGLVVSTGLSRVLERFLYEIRPNDPVTMATAVLAMLLSAFAAAWIPARSALKIEPMVVLRDE